jgi:hypothetical protein
MPRTDRMTEYWAAQNPSRGIDVTPWSRAQWRKVFAVIMLLFAVVAFGVMVLMAMVP